MAIDLQELKDALKDNLTVVLSNPEPDVINGQATQVVLKWNTDVISSSKIQNVGGQYVEVFSGTVKSATEYYVITEEETDATTDNFLEVNGCNPKEISEIVPEDNQIFVKEVFEQIPEPGDVFKIMATTLKLK